MKKQNNKLNYMYFHTQLWTEKNNCGFDDIVPGLETHQTRTEVKSLKSALPKKCS